MFCKRIILVFEIEYLSALKNISYKQNTQIEKLQSKYMFWCLPLLAKKFTL